MKKNNYQGSMPMMKMSGPAAYPQYGMGQPQPAGIGKQFMPFPSKAPLPLTTIYEAISKKVWMEANYFLIFKVMAKSIISS